MGPGAGIISRSLEGCLALKLGLDQTVSGESELVGSPELMMRLPSLWRLSSSTASRFKGKTASMPFWEEENAQRLVVWCDKRV